MTRPPSGRGSTQAPQFRKVTTYLLTYLLTYYLTYLLAYLLTHSLTHSLTYLLTLTLSPAIARALFDEPLTLAAAAAFEEDAARGGAYAGENPLNDTR